MKYSNLQILKELKHIDKCLGISFTEKEGTENIRKCIYKNGNSGIIDFLIENNYVRMNTVYDQNIIPLINPYGRDFLKKWWISCFVEDYKEVVYIVGVIATMIGTYYGYLSYLNK